MQTILVKINYISRKLFQFQQQWEAILFVVWNILHSYKILCFILLYFRKWLPRESTQILPLKFVFASGYFSKQTEPRNKSEHKN